MMEAASTSETSVNFYETALRYNPEDSRLHILMFKALRKAAQNVRQDAGTLCSRNVAFDVGGLLRWAHIVTGLSVQQSKYL
jgi:hypothetical protein